MKSNKIFVILLFLSVQFSSFSVKAQKESYILSHALKLPLNYKIDGLSNEWDNRFITNNKSLGISYTIANNKDKVYLIVQAQNLEIIKKIINNGITFSLFKGTQVSSVGFPYYQIGTRPLYLPVSKRQNMKEPKNVNDSLMNVFNRKIIDNFKNIEVIGFNGIMDSLISIYNPEGIRIAAKFDSQLYLNLEIAIPLKYVENGNKINYKIQLNGVPGDVKVIQASGGDRIGFVSKDGVNYLIGMATPENYAYAYPSDFSGSILLFKE